MLAKIWKKLLLAICIIACLFNITYKLVNRISLEKVISTQPEGVNVKELLNITDEQPVVTNTNTTSTYNVVETEPTINNAEEQPLEQTDEPAPTEQPVENEETEQPNNGPVTVTDFIDKVVDGTFEQ